MLEMTSSVTLKKKFVMKISRIFGDIGAGIIWAKEVKLLPVLIFNRFSKYSTFCESLRFLHHILDVLWKYSILMCTFWNQITSPTRLNIRSFAINARDTWFKVAVLVASSTYNEGGQRFFRLQKICFAYRLIILGCSLKIDKMIKILNFVARAIFGLRSTL